MADALQEEVEVHGLRHVLGIRPLAEVDYFLRDEREAMSLFMRDLGRGAFTCAPPSIEQLSRAMEVDRRFATLGLGLADASIVALAESLGVPFIADQRDDLG